MLGFNKLNEEEVDMAATTVAVDLAKEVFEVATANRSRPDLRAQATDAPTVRGRLPPRCRPARKS